MRFQTTRPNSRAACRWIRSLIWAGCVCALGAGGWGQQLAAQNTAATDNFVRQPNDDEQISWEATPPPAEVPNDWFQTKIKPDAGQTQTVLLQAVPVNGMPVQTAQKLPSQWSSLGESPSAVTQSALQTLAIAPPPENSPPENSPPKNSPTNAPPTHAAPPQSRPATLDAAKRQASHYQVAQKLAANRSAESPLTLVLPGKAPATVTAATSPGQIASETEKLSDTIAPFSENPSLLFWWHEPVSQTVLNRSKWVTFDMETVLVDTLRHSPSIKGVAQRTGSALERIVQQDAAFDSTVLFSGTGGRTNDPVGNTLTTGGPSRLQEESLSVRGGITKNGRRGTELGLTQEVGIKSSNSTFFIPEDQGDARLSLSLTQPLLDRAGQVYNERLLTQARISSRVTWQEMRRDVETRIADVMNAYWNLYEVRCHLLQQRQLLARGVQIEEMVLARNGFDSSRIELAKAKQRTARRTDQLVVLDAEVRKRQVRLATLIGSDALCGAGSALELIPQETPVFPDQDWDVRDVLVKTLENRPEIRSATAELEAAALAVRVTRTELVPQLNAVINASLSSLNGDNRIDRSFFDQFSGIGPGFSAGLQYEMPYGRRAARSRVREAQHQYRQRAEALREVIQKTQWESESALIDLQRTSKQHQTKRNLLVTAIEEETVLTRRWEMMGSDGSRVGVVLGNLLDAQQRRTDAEQEYVSAQTQYVIALISMQRAMGTLLRAEGIQATREGCSDVDFVRHGEEFSAEHVLGESVSKMTPGAEKKGQPTTQGHLTTETPLNQSSDGMPGSLQPPSQSAVDATKTTATDSASNQSEQGIPSYARRSSPWARKANQQPVNIANQSGNRFQPSTPVNR
ncbi:TolC family protein [Planctomycetes bacterium K23_9]|uniref:Outer membrane efflux protein n=1 Tax=Stieleria marina TaxID=1930275 RepID=A0A517NX44_9BACT|nr:Outer membrane efflux protein [Planctomycetes bacterium K23_9]